MLACRHRGLLSWAPGIGAHARSPRDLVLITEVDGGAVASARNRSGSGLPKRGWDHPCVNYEGAVHHKPASDCMHPVPG